VENKGRFAALALIVGAIALSGCSRICRAREDAAFDMGEARGRYMQEMQNPCRDKSGRYVKCQRDAAADKMAR